MHVERAEVKSYKYTECPTSVVPTLKPKLCLLDGRTTGLWWLWWLWWLWSPPVVQVWLDEAPPLLQLWLKDILKEWLKEWFQEPPVAQLWWKEPLEPPPLFQL